MCFIISPTTTMHIHIMNVSSPLQLFSKSTHKPSFALGCARMVVLLCRTVAARSLVHFTLTSKSWLLFVSIYMQQNKTSVAKCIKANHHKRCSDMVEAVRIYMEHSSGEKCWSEWKVICSVTFKIAPQVMRMDAVMFRKDRSKSLEILSHPLWVYFKR